MLFISTLKEIGETKITKKYQASSLHVTLSGEKFHIGKELEIYYGADLDVDS